MRFCSHTGRLVALGVAIAIVIPIHAQQCQICPVTGLPVGSRGQTPSMFRPTVRSHAPPPANTIPKRPAIAAPHKPPATNIVPRKSLPKPVPSNRLVGPTGRTEANVPGHVTPSNHVAPPRNIVPVSSRPDSRTNSSSGQASKMPPKAKQIQPPCNLPFSRSVVKLTPANVEEMKRQLLEHESKLLDQLSQRANGNPKAMEAIDRLRDHVQNRTVTGKDIADVVAAIMELPEADRDAALRDLAGIVTDEQVGRWLDDVRENGQGRNQLADGRTGREEPGTGDANNNDSVQGDRNGRQPGGRVGNVGPDNIAGNPDAGRNRGGDTGAGQQAGPNRANPNGANPNRANPDGANPNRANPNGANPNINLNIAIGAVPGLPAGLIIPLGGFGGGDGFGAGGFGGGPALVGMGQAGDQIAMGMGDPAEMAGFPEAPPDAVPAPGAPPTPPSFGDIILVNTGSGPISYNVNTDPFTMQPEEEQTLPSGTEWTVEFDRGNGRGTARYTVISGTYEFRADENGWDLFEKSFDATIDNSENPTPFGYVVDNQEKIVPPGESQKITSRYRPIVRFDDGKGDIKERQLDGSNFRVAMNSSKQLDIYPGEAFDNGKPSGRVPAPRVPEDATTKASPSAPSMTLPAGFRMFDPVEAITKSEVGLGLPGDFSLFRSTAAEIAKQGPNPAVSAVQ